MAGRTRREALVRGIAGTLAAGLQVSAQPRSPAFKIGGVDFGVETFSFHDLPPAGDPQLIPTLIQDM
ncbi:MAG: hypothetical protein KGN84_07030, partial [Acidobacteriota bacterium]|nr:hypothetical protein [Acidobacteriota bacterium]